MDYNFVSKLGTVVAILALFSVLYKENKFYRFFEHVFLGLAAGWAIVAMVKDVLKPLWWDKMMGMEASTVAGATATAEPGRWAYVLLLPLGIMGYLVFNRKHNWMSRIPIGIILGLFSGQQISVWFNTYGPQIQAAMLPIFPTTTESLLVPSGKGLSKEQLAEIGKNVYASQALTNVLFIMTLTSVLSYFLFSFDVKSKFVKNYNIMGRYLLMIGFGAIFGSTIMMRFTLLIDRMHFVWIEFFRDLVLPKLTGR